MRILIIVGGYLRENSSANLCHRAYIQGFLDNGCDVTVISASDNDCPIDRSIELPVGAKYITFEGSRITKYAKNKSKQPSSYARTSNEGNSSKKRFLLGISFMKRVFRKIYGGHFGYDSAWLRKTVKSYQCWEPFDLIVSLSYPATSHVAAYKLLKKDRIRGKFFCQLWEDPWCYDVYCNKIEKSRLKCERKIVRYADKVLYVSPVTKDIQAELFSETASKMDWLPLPYYYKDKNKSISFEKLTFGYFGDYQPTARNLQPFYNTARKMRLETYICGSPANLFQSTDSISIHPRLPLNELKIYEDKVNVLVFVCNLKYGQIPGKIYQYSATNKKILFILDGTEEEKTVLYTYFKSFKRYHFCDNTEDDIVRAINNLYDASINDNCVEYFSPKNITRLICKKCGKFI